MRAPLKDLGPRHANPDCETAAAVEGKAPAIYMVDGNLYTAFAVNPAMGAGLGEYAPVYFVGIDYLEQSARHWFRQRVTDLIHAPDVDLKDPRVEVSRAAAAPFQRFLVEEVRPVIESRYLIDPERTVLSGVSLGGLFATRVLLDQPDAFSAYLIGSLSLWAEPDIIARARSARLREGTKIYIAAGAVEEAEHLASAQALAAALRENTSGVVVTEWMVPDDGHVGFAPAFFSQGLKSVLPSTSPSTP